MDKTYCLWEFIINFVNQIKKEVIGCSGTVGKIKLQCYLSGYTTLLPSFKSGWIKDLNI